MSRFDSEILENEFVRTSMPTLRTRLRYCLVYTLLATSVWCLYWLVLRAALTNVLLAMALMLLCALVLAATGTRYYKVSCSWLTR